MNYYEDNPRQRAFLARGDWLAAILAREDLSVVIGLTHERWRLSGSLTLRERREPHELVYSAAVVDSNLTVGAVTPVCESR
jgi:hypothetical protein